MDIHIYIYMGVYVLNRQYKGMIQGMIRHGGTIWGCDSLKQNHHDTRINNNT